MTTTTTMKIIKNKRLPNPFKVKNKKMKMNKNENKNEKKNKNEMNKMMEKMKNKKMKKKNKPTYMAKKFVRHEKKNKIMHPMHHLSDADIAKRERKRGQGGQGPITVTAVAVTVVTAVVYSRPTVVYLPINEAPRPPRDINKFFSNSNAIEHGRKCQQLYPFSGLV